MELIEREAALEVCEKEYQERLRMLDYCGDTVAWNIGNAIKKIPTIDAAPVVHGHWIKRDGYTECSECEYWYDSPESEDDGDRPNYCPNCGARMDGGDWHDAD